MVKVKYMYKSIDGQIYNEIPNNFNGYEIKSENSTTSTIREFKNSEHIGSIVIRPTKIPVIFSVKYQNYREERYNNGVTSCKYYTINNNLNGEYRKYNTSSELTNIKFYYQGNEVTDDIISLLKIKNDLVGYEFSDEEKFNIMVSYGSNFKFFDEYNVCSTTFDKIMKFCLME